MMHDLLDARMASGGTSPFIYAGGRSFSYAEFAADVERWAAWLSRLALPRHACVAVSVADPYLFAALLFAAERIALVIMPLPAGTPLTSELLVRWRVAAIVADRDPPESIAAAWVRVAPDWRDALARSGLSPAPRVERALDDPLFVYTSSGTTGAPKRLLCTRRVLEARNGAQRDIRFVAERQKLLCLVPFAYYGGVATLLRSLFAGGSIAYVGERPDWGALLAGGSFDCIISGPRHLIGILNGLPAGYVHDRPLRIAVGGNALPPPLAAEVRKRLTDDIFVTYGATETGVVAQAHIDEIKGADEAAGVAIGGVEIEVVDRDGAAMPPGRIGEIRMRGPQIIRGYIDDPAATARHYRGEWYYPGDLGSLDEAGTLSVSGRVDDVINVGPKLLPSEIERRVLAVAPGIDVAAFPARRPGATMASLWIAYVAPLTLPPAVLDRVSVPSVDRLFFVRLDEIPRNLMGKVERARLRAAVEAALRHDTGLPLGRRVADQLRR